MDRRQFNRGAALSAAAIGGMFPRLVTGALAGGSWADAFERALEKNPSLLGYQAVASRKLATDTPVIEGKLPDSLTGTLFRNGPAQHNLKDERYHHWFDGDGMVNAYRFAGGTMSHLGRIVETKKYLAEQEAGRFLYPAFGTHVENAAPVRSPDTVNAANISVLPMEDRLYALWEGGSAYELDSETLETIGPKVWSDQTEGVPFSAHPRVDTGGTVWNFGYFTALKKIILWHVNGKGALQKFAALDVDPITIPHDFVVTERYMIILLAPLHYKEARTRGGSFLSNFEWTPQDPARVLIIDKNTFQMVSELDLPAQWVFHFSNAWEDSDGTIRFEGARYPDVTLMVEDFSLIMKGLPGVAEEQARLTQYKIGPNLNQITEQTVFNEDVYAEFPVIDPRSANRRHDFVVMLTANLNGPSAYGALDTVTKASTSTGEVDSYTYPEGQIPEEHLFVRDASGKEWVVGTSLDYGLKATKVNVFAAERLSDGPVSVVTLPYVIPLGLHGKFQLG